MTDFFTSLDRALAREDLATPHWLAPEPLENPSGIPPLSNGWQDLGYVSYDESHDISRLMDAINRSVADMILASAYFAIDSTTTDDDLPGMWQHFDFLGGDPDERSYAERGWSDNTVVLQWRDPAPIFFYGSPEWQAYYATLMALPLCDQELPAEGTE